MFEIVRQKCELLWNCRIWLKGECTTLVFAVACVFFVIDKWWNTTTLAYTVRSFDEKHSRPLFVCITQISSWQAHRVWRERDMSKPVRQGVGYSTISRGHHSAPDTPYKPDCDGSMEANATMLIFNVCIHCTNINTTKINKKGLLIKQYNTAASNNNDPLRLNY